MTAHEDPVRLRDGASEDVRWVVGSVDDDEPRGGELAGLTRRLGALLGPIAVADPSLPPAAHSPGPAPPAAPPSLAPAPAAAVGVVTLAKWKGILLIAAAIAGVGGGGGAAYYATRRAASAPASAPTAFADPPRSEIAPQVVASTAPEAVTEPEATPAASVRSPEPSHASAAEEGVDESSLLLDAAGALRRGDASRAIALTNEHARRFPRGKLVEERERLAIEALVRAGRRGEAKARAGRFFSHFPRSVQRPRLEALLGSGD